MRWLLATIVLGCCGIAVPGQVGSDHGFELRCVDREGVAVADAEVFVFQRLGLPGQAGNYTRFGPFRTGEDGRTACPVALTYGDGWFDRFAYARVPGRLVGGVRSHRFEAGPTEAGDGAIVVRLGASRSLAGSVKVPDGYAASDVRVVIMSAYDLLDAEAGGFGTPLARVYGMIGLEDALPQIFETAVDAAGQFELRDIPERARIYLRADGPGLAQCQFSNPQSRLPEFVEFRLVEESKLDGRIFDPGHAGVGGLRVRARLMPGTEGCSMLTEFRGTTDASGRFEIGGLPRGSVELHVDLEQGELVHPPLFVATGMPGSTTSTRVQLVAPVLLEGRVLAAIDRTPIAHVLVMVIGEDPERGGITSARTDEVGRFRLRVPPVKVQLYFGSIPAGFVYPEPQIIDQIDVAPGRPALRMLRYELERRD